MNTNTYTPASVAKFATLNGTTSAILELARALVIDKEFLSRADFSKLVESFNWGKETVKSYINIGVAFAGIEISKLINIEPRTLFKITSSKRFSDVVDGILNAVGNITQKFVENLIQSNKKTPVPSQQTPTIWRGEGAARRCVVPPIKEDDQFTGTTIQRAMDSEGITAQKFVREAAAYREACKIGAFQLVGELPPHLAAILGIDSEAPTKSDDDNDEVEIKVAETVAVTTPSNENVEKTASAAVEETVLQVEVVQAVVEETTPIEIEQTAVEEVVAAPTIANYIEEQQPQAMPTGELSVSEIAALLMECNTWSDIMAITEALDKPTCVASWTLLDKDTQARILELKKASTSIQDNPNSIEEVTPIIRVGDKVVWENCWPHISSWNPFIVENIEDDYAKLNNLKTPVPIDELSLVS